MNRLKIHRAGQAIQELPIEPPVTLGRRNTCEVQLEDPGISREHARVRRVDGGWVLEDLGSINGTLLNGRRLAHREVARLASGDRIAIHPYEVELLLAGDDDSPATIVTRREETAQSKRAVAAAAAAAAPAASPVPPAPVFTPTPVRSHLVLQREALPVWTSGALEVAVADIVDETHDTKTFRLVGATPTAFCYRPGQSIQIQVPIDGKLVKRSYSISSSPSRPHAIELTIKRCQGGLVSNWMADNAKLGQTFKISGPYGKFSCFEHPAPKIFMLAAGSGVTPLMSMTRWLTDTSADVDIVLLYSVRSPMDIIFGRELEYLAARHPSLRVVITATATRAGTHGWTGIANRVDRHLMRLAAPDVEDREVFMCGPKPFADAMLNEFGALGIAPERVRQESFGGAPPPKPAAAAAPPPVIIAVPELPKRPPDTSAPSRAAAAVVKPESTIAPRNYPAPRQAPAVAAHGPQTTAAPSARPRAAAPSAPASPAPSATSTPPVPASPVATGFVVRFARTGLEARAAGAQSLLEIGEELGVDLPSGCRGGSCGTCEQTCTSGQVSIDGEVFAPPSRDGGRLRLCVATPCSDVVIEA